jgi:hypothetical protein
MTHQAQGTTQGTAQGTTELLAEIAAGIEGEEISVGELVDRLADRGFGLVLLVLSLPVCIPFLYGIPQAVAVPMIFLAAQIAAGRHTLWMPEKARARTITKEGLLSLADRSKRYVGWFERIASPHLTWATHGLAERLFGAMMVIFCASVLVPLPLTNTAPGFAIAIMSIGFLERDGRLVFLGAILGGIWVSLLLYFGITLGVEGLDLLRSYF